MKFEKCGLGFQNLYNMPKGVEVPWLTYQQFGNLVGNLTDMIVEEENWQPMIDAAWEMRSPEDYDDKFSTAKNDFLRTWHMVGGKLSEARFQMLADDYEQEQAELREKIDILEDEIQQQEDQTENVDKFIRQAKKYLHLEKLTLQC